MPMTDPLQSFSMAGKVVWVVDASTRLGARFARLIARAGAQVAIGAQHSWQLDQLAADLRCEGAVVLTVSLNSECRVSVEAALATIQECLGNVDVLINNSGEHEYTPLNEHIVHCTNLHMMNSEHGGSIVTIEPPSSAISEPNPCLRPNSSLIRMSRALTQSLAPHRVRVSVIAAGHGDNPRLKESRRSSSMT